MVAFKRFEEIIGWQKARDLTREVYSFTSRSAVSRDFGFRDQIRGAAVSSMSNIAEGFDRKTDREFQRFLYISRASASEVQSLLYVALDQEYIEKAKFDTVYALADEVKKLVGGLIQSLEKTQ